ncbi:MAG: ferritin-like domain-containing protein [Pseudobdellovibrio sp.]
MLTQINDFFIMNMTGIYWKLFPNKKIQTIQKFSGVEYDSCWQLLTAIPQFDDAYTRSQLFMNALEELRHGQLFEAEFNRLSATRNAVEIAGRKSLLEKNPTEDDFRDFLMFFHVGEEDVCKKFKLLSQLPLEKSLRDVFTEIVNDEALHGSGSLELIRRRGVTDKEIKRRSLLNWWGNKKDQVYRFFQKIDGPIFVCLTLVYFVFGMFLHKSLKKRFNLSRDEQLVILQKQISDHVNMVKHT